MGQRSTLHTPQQTGGFSRFSRILAFRPEKGSLIQGLVLTSFRGWDNCLFHCDLRVVGTKELTDGVWLWPEGLYHYVERHSVCLPDEFIESMRSRSWRIPEHLREELLARFERQPAPAEFYKWL